MSEENIIIDVNNNNDQIDIKGKEIEEIQFNSSNISIVWDEDAEYIIKEWADKAKCYKWLYEQSYKLYYVIYLLFTLPVILITTITGTANFAQTQVPLEFRTYFAMTAGALSLVAGMITTISQFLKISELKETYNMCYKSWDKFGRTLSMDLQLSPLERGDKKTLIESCKKEYDRLVELSPTIPNIIGNYFRAKFKNTTDKDNPNNRLIKPDIVDTIYPTRIFDRNKLPKDSEKTKYIPENKNTPTMVDIFKQKFFEKYGREPTIEEINDELDIVI